MKILAIESSCDETAAALVEDGRIVLRNEVVSQIPIHERYGGVVPEIASRCHIEAIEPLVERALGGETPDAVAVTYAPGQIGALLVGVNYAKSLAYTLNVPLIPVHHLRGHVASNYLTHPDLKPPFTALIASGGHSHIVHPIRNTKFWERRGTMRQGKPSTNRHESWAWDTRAAPKSKRRQKRGIPMPSSFRRFILRMHPMISAFRA